MFGDDLINKLEIQLKNCYGIKALNCNFEFVKTKKSQIIYAQNGLMKSSLAKTFDDISKQDVPKDIIHKIDGEAIIKADDNKIDPANIYVVHSEAKYFESDKMSSLLVNNKLRKEYENELKEVEDKQEKLFLFLREKFGYRDKNKVMSIFTKVFEKTENNFLDFLEECEDRVNSADQYDASVVYKDVFDDKVKIFLSNDNFREILGAYIDTYEKLILSSRYFKKGVFNHNNAEDVCKSLKNNKFFEAEHAVHLRGMKAEFKSIDSFEKEIEDDKNRIFDDVNLKKKFTEIDKAINRNKELVNFRNYIESNPEMIVKLNDVKSFEKEVLFSYLKESEELYINLIKIYRKAKIKIESIIKQAKSEETEWKKVVETFNERFDIPIKLRIQNQDDVILKTEKVPQIQFIHDDYNENKCILDKETFLEILSTGEKRAVYILNILFEIQVRKKTNNDQLVIIDDIADSFDYRNKYAILEYLQELSEENNKIYMVILTHNFDFYRSMQSRFFGKGRKQSYMAIKNDDSEIELTQARYINAFDYFKKSYYKDEKIFIATIAFVRNLIEYTKGIDDDEYKKLTSVLHKKKDSDLIVIKDIKQIIDNILNSKHDYEFNADENTSIAKFICKISDDIINDGADGTNLENKIVLSIAIRSLAERKMIEAIEKKEKEFSNEIEEKFNQTYYIYKKYIALFPDKSSFIKLLKKVNLMTPENIHINSFMYEPILDLGEKQLRNLYKGFREY